MTVSMPALSRGAAEAAAAAAVFTLLVVLLLTEGGQRIVGLGSCLALLALVTVLRARGSRHLPLAGAVTVGIAVGGVLALTGAASHLLFTPVVLLLVTVAVTTGPWSLGAAVVPAAAGYALPAALSSGDGRSVALVLGVTAGLVLVPLAARPACARLLPRAPADDDVGVVETAPPEPAPGVAAGLTPRQAEVVALVAAGLHHAEIAERLAISTRQVTRHLANARARTGSQTTRQLVARLIDEDVTPEGAQ